MTRPIFWALGVTAAAAMWGGGLAARFESSASRSNPIAMNAGEPTGNRAVTRDGGSNTVTLDADPRGHFSTDAAINGRTQRMLVDTGASLCAFSYEDAERLGLHVYERDFNRPVETANGTTYGARVVVPVIRIGTISLRDVEAMVLPRGRLGTSLLGMSFLRRLDDVKMTNGRLSLRG